MQNNRMIMAFMAANLAIIGTQAYADSINLTPFARHDSGIFNEGAAEIPAYHPGSRSVFVVNGHSPSVDIMTLSANGQLTPRPSLVLAKTESPTSVAVHKDVVAVAVHDDKSRGRPGKVVFFTPAGKRLTDVPVGSLPDMVTFTPDGRYALVANEGEPHDDVDPEGSISVIDLSQGVAKATVRTADFKQFDAASLKAAGVRLFPGKTPAEDLEPEYIAVSKDSRTAYVSLQEANAVATVDIATARVTKILPLGVKDHSKPGNGLDPNDKDGVAINTFPVFGLYMPDAIAAYESGGITYLITANEGDARDEDAKLNEANIAPGVLTPMQASKLEKLRISTIDGLNAKGEIAKIHSYGARSFSIWNTNGTQVYDSGDQFERITAKRFGPNFNSDHEEMDSGDKRSDNKGPEPEGLAIGEVSGRTYVFVGLERVGGVMVYDVTDPKTPQFIDYRNDRSFKTGLDYSKPADLAKAGDLGPEGLAFVTAADSPTGTPLLIVANEVSGTTVVYKIDVTK